MTEISLQQHKKVHPAIRRRKVHTHSPPSWPLWSKFIALSMVVYVMFVVYVLISMELEPDSHVRSVTGSQHDSSPELGSVRQHGDVGYNFDRSKAESALKEYGASSIRKIVTAYIETPMNDTIPGTGSQGDPDDKKDTGRPPEFVIPLPLRTNAPEDLIKVEYPKLQTCHDVPSKIPVDRGLQIDSQGNQIVWNIGDKEMVPDDYHDCPVDADPFLPWIHDVFPNQDGTMIEFIAQNKRRCKTGTKFLEDLRRMEPQVALMQPVSVERINESEARRMAPELWHPEHGVGQTDDSSPRYRLAPFEESAKDGRETRFICRFHATDFSRGSSDRPVTVVLGETLSKYPFNYEFVSYRKSFRTMLTPRGKDSELFWTSNLRFECPVPDLRGLSTMIANGGAILSDGTPTIHVDLIPLRTPPRYGPYEYYFPDGMISPKKEIMFDAEKRWGHRNVMPRIEASGRWENMPVCFPPAIGSTVDTTTSHVVTPTQKPHVLSACLWSAASFRTRGRGHAPVTDTLRRLEEWLEFHFMVGFDHIYVYDNSAAQTNETSLAELLDTYPSSKVTRIDWPSVVCNNNIPAHDNTGERSSQYAAENSCLARYAPFTEWIASFDTDEYLVPMGNYTSLKDVVRDAGRGGTNILSLRSTRGKLRYDFSREEGRGREMIDTSTFLDAYNCDSSSLPKPSWADRARKQIYRSDFVFYHFVHYSTVTQGMLETYRENPKNWRRHFGERSPSERVTNEETEALMVHAKTTSSKQSVNWFKRCHYQFEKKWRGCFVGFPWPNGTVVKGDGGHRDDGMEFNCFENYRITQYWGPRLRDALARRHSSLAEV